MTVQGWIQAVGMEGCDRAPKVGQEIAGLQSGRNGSYSASPSLRIALTCKQLPAALPPQLQLS